MPALAIPLLIPFAEAAGIAIGTLTTAAGLDILSDKVEDYIEDNPENAQKIFAMIMPEQGLANILKNESDDGEEVSETEEVAESESGSTKDMVLEELNKKTGNYSDPNATGNYASTRGRIIGRLKREGKIRQDNDPNYDPDKKYKGYTKFYKKKYADGGMMEYANGGGVGSMMQTKKKSYEDQSLTKAEQKKTKPVDQGGGPNYLGKQEEVTTPRKWLSSPDHVVAELAYITPKEQKILLDANIYGSLEGKPNRGPNGIMSLQGDLGGYGGPGPGNSSGNNNNNSGGGGGYKNTDHFKMMTGNLAKGQTTKTGPRTRQYSNLPEWMKGPSGNMQHAASAYKSYGQPSFFGNLFSRGAPGYRGIKGLSAFGKPTFKNDGTNYITEDEDFGEVKPGMGGRILGGLASLLTGVPLVGSLIGNQIDRFKPKSYMEKQTPEELSRMRGLQMIDGQLVDTRMLDFDPNAQTQRPTSVPMDSLSLNNFNKQPTQLFDPNNIQSLINNAASKNTQPQEIDMMTEYYNNIDNKATGPNIVPDASEIAQQAKVFGLQDLQGIGALKEGKVYGYNTTDQGDALEKFRNSAVNFYNSPNNTNKTPQSAYDFMMNTNPNMFKDVKENKDYIQNTINQGFLENQTDYKNQKSLEDFT